LLVSRLVVVGLGIFAVLQAAHFESILRAALYAYTVYGAAITPSVMAVFLWERATAAGAVASIASGTAVTVLWNLSGIRFLDAIYPALAVSVVSLIVVSLVTGGRISMTGKPRLARKSARAKGGECEGR